MPREGLAGGTKQLAVGRRYETQWVAAHRQPGEPGDVTPTQLDTFCSEPSGGASSRVTALSG